MSKTVALVDHKTVGRDAATVAAAIERNLRPSVGVIDHTERGWGVLRSLERQGDTYRFALEFEGSDKFGPKTITVHGNAAGTVTMVPLGTSTTRLDVRVDVNLDGVPRFTPDAMIRRELQKEIDDLFVEMLADIDGPAQPGQEVA